MNITELTLEQAVQNFLKAVGDIKSLTKTIGIGDHTIRDGGYSIHLRDEEFDRLSEGRKITVEPFDNKDFMIKKSFHIEGVELYCITKLGEEEWFRLKGYVKEATA